MPKLIASTALLVSLAGCAMSDEGYPIHAGYEIHGVAAPWGPVYFGDEPASAFIVAHEMCHLERIRDYGMTAFYIRYFADKAFACQEERECGFFGPHPAC
jgi:hypothetical protein